MRRYQEWSIVMRDYSECDRPRTTKKIKPKYWRSLKNAQCLYKNDEGTPEIELTLGKWSSHNQGCIDRMSLMATCDNLWRYVDKQGIDKKKSNGRKMLRYAHRMMVANRAHPGELVASLKTGILPSWVQEQFGDDFSLLESIEKTTSNEYVNAGLVFV